MQMKKYRFKRVEITYFDTEAPTYEDAHNGVLEMIEEDDRKIDQQHILVNKDGEKLCSECCESVLRHDEQEADTCEPCCDDMVINDFETACDDIMEKRYGTTCSDAGIDREQLEEARNESSADEFVEHIANKYGMQEI